LKAVVAALILVAATAGFSLRSNQGPHDVSFVVALRTFESQSVALADQASSESSSPAVRHAAGVLAAHSRDIGARLWVLLDQWAVPGPARLPQRGPVNLADPTAQLRHACALVANDELGRLSLLSGAVFDQNFARDWVAHAQAALTAFTAAPPGTPVVADARRLLTTDISVLAAALA
jgi:hypothetical protein